MIDSCFPAYFTQLFAIKDRCLADGRYAEICSKFLDACFESFTVVEWRQILVTFFVDYVFVRLKSYVAADCLPMFELVINSFNSFLANEIDYDQMCFSLRSFVDKLAGTSHGLSSLVFDFSFYLYPFLTSFDRSIDSVLKKLMEVQMFVDDFPETFSTDKFWADVFMWFFSAVEQIRAHKERQVKV